MQKHNCTRASARLLPTEKPQQLPLPGIPPAPHSLSNLVRETAKKHRYLISGICAIGILYLIGQGTAATGLLFAGALYQVNTFIDRQMTGGGNDQQ